MRTLRLTIAYKGTAYHGFQVQRNAVTVCEVFQNAVEKVFGIRYDVKGCSRTDTGVHARAFVLSMKIAEAIPCESIIRALNVNLPFDIVVADCTEADEGFHPRYDARGKRYSYRICNSAVRNPFEADTALHLSRPLDVAVMQQAASHMVGRHDFSAFCASGGKVDDKVRTLYRCDVTRTGELVTIEVEGDGFLYNMVRIIAGTLIEVSQGKHAPDDLPNIIASGNRERAGATAPAHGLCLEEVYY